MKGTIVDLGMVHRPTRDQWAMSIAELTSQRTTCKRRAVGAVLLNERGHLIAAGYNGVAAGMPHCNERVVRVLAPTVKNEFAEVWEYPNACPGADAPSGTQLDACGAIHAEQNALLQCKNIYEITACYVTTAPCVTCTKLLMNTSCKEIMFMDDYPQAAASKALWESAGRIWRHYS